MSKSEKITIIGGGLAGCEAAWQVASQGGYARLFEMRPQQKTPAHKTEQLAEIVCSNSLKSDQPHKASWLLKEELRYLGSLLLKIADKVRVPAGSALAVDRQRFAAEVTKAIESAPNIDLIRKEMPVIPEKGIVIVASGPLTSSSLSQSIKEFCGQEHLYFYDAISPIVDAETIDETKMFRASRYKEVDGDYLNCALDQKQYARFYKALISAQGVNLQEFEETRYFEACLPIEELARRGVDTLRFGPMKPVGLDDPGTGMRPYAVVQLRQEDTMETSYNLVGFQNHLKFPEQRRIFRMIPGLEHAEFLRLGQIHRNTYINSPDILSPTMASRSNQRVFFAGQLAGTEGYIENIGTGLVAGLNAVRLARGEPLMAFPRITALGALCGYVSTPQKYFAPMNINFGLLPPLETNERIPKLEKQRLICTRALKSMSDYAIGAL